MNRDLASPRCENTACFCSGACMDLYDPNKPSTIFAIKAPIAPIIIDNIEYEPIPSDILEKDKPI